MRFIVVISILSIFNCGETESERCRSICQKEADCAESRENPDESYPYDVDECTAACASLERDTTTKHMVDSHAECASKAGESCEALKRCGR